MIETLSETNLALNIIMYCLDLRLKSQNERTHVCTGVEHLGIIYLVVQQSIVENE